MEVDASSTPVEVMLSDWDISLDRPSAPAGSITFQVMSDSHHDASGHQLVVLKTPKDASQLPVEDSRALVDGANITEMGSTDNLQELMMEDLALDLTEGHYVLICNIPGHYRRSMYANFTVTPTLGTQVTARLSDTGIALDRSTAPAGPVTFTVINDGPSTQRFVVLRTPLDADALPLLPDGSVDTKAPQVKEVGGTGMLTINLTKTIPRLELAPGHYVIVSDLPGRYEAGVHADFTVTAP